MPVIGTLFFENEVNKVCIFDKNSISKNGKTPKETLLWHEKTDLE